MARCDSDNDSGAGPPGRLRRYCGVDLRDKRWRVDLAKISAKQAWQTLSEKVDHSLVASHVQYWIGKEEIIAGLKYTYVSTEMVRAMRRKIWKPARNGLIMEEERNTEKTGRKRGEKLPEKNPKENLRKNKRPEVTET
jgi:hypothetical protein